MNTLPSEIAERLPSVRLLNLPTDCFMTRAHIKPIVKSHAGKQSKKFQIIPLLDRNGSVDLEISPIQTKEELLFHMKNEWKYVAIRCEKGKFISCRKGTYGPFLGQTALTEYRGSIGEYETFWVQYDSDTDCFSFLSHNGLYMSVNQNIWTVAFRAESVTSKFHHRKIY